MKDFVKILDEQSNNIGAKINLLSEYKTAFNYFAPYWFELGSAYQEAENYREAKKCYYKFETLKKNYSIIDNDSYYTELAKNMIAMAINEDDPKTIRKYLAIVENDGTVATKSKNRFYAAGIYFYLNDYIKAKSLLKLVIDKNDGYAFEAREMFKTITIAQKTSEEYKHIFLSTSLKIASEDEIQELVDKQKASTAVNADEKKVLNKNNIVFTLPTDNVQGSSLRLKINEKYYNSLQPIIIGETAYYVVDYKLSNLLSKTDNFTVILKMPNSNFTAWLEFSSEYFDSGKIKSINKALSIISPSENEENIDIDKIDISAFFNSISNLEKDKTYKDKEDSEKRVVILNKYEVAKKNYFNQKTFQYVQRKLQNEKSYIFRYGQTELSLLTNGEKKVYTFSKYGEIKEKQD